MSAQTPGSYPGHRLCRSHRSCQQTGEAGVSIVIQAEVTVKAALERQETGITSNVITTWASVRPRIRRIMPPRTAATRLRTRNSIRKMHGLGNKKWTELTVAFLCFL